MTDNEINFIWKNNNKTKPPKKGLYMCFLFKENVDGDAVFNFLECDFNGDPDNPIWTNNNVQVFDNIIAYWAEIDDINNYYHE